MWVHGFECARALRSLVCVPCFLLEHGVRIPALMSCVSVSCRGFAHSRSIFCLVVWACGRKFVCPCALLSTCIVFCVVACSSCFYRAFMLCLVLSGTQLMFFIGCVLSCCHVWTHGLWVFSLAVTQDRLPTEAKQGWAWSVPLWETSWEN